jgi:hypothetical protein
MMGRKDPVYDVMDYVDFVVWLANALGLEPEDLDANIEIPDSLLEDTYPYPVDKYAVRAIRPMTDLMD